MVRVIAFVVGLVFAGVLLISMISNAAGYFSNPPAPLASDEFHREPKELALSSDGPFGKFDKAELQRGFQVYSEVCSACHSLKLASFRDLKGLGYNEAEIKKIASDWKTQVASINPDTGEAATRKALASDTFPPPFAKKSRRGLQTTTPFRPIYPDHQGARRRSRLRLFTADRLSESAGASS